MNITIQQFAVALRKGMPAVQKALEQAMKEAGGQAWKDAQHNAPKSPTGKQAWAQRRADWVAKHGDGRASIRRFNANQDRGKARRKADSHSRHAPGGLEKSIQWRLTGRGMNLDAEIYVAANAEAGKYAKRIHDEKGKTWRKRGPGTVAKGAQADDKYILRAVQKAAKEFPEQFRKRLGR